MANLDDKVESGPSWWFVGSSDSISLFEDTEVEAGVCFSPSLLNKFPFPTK